MKTQEHLRHSVCFRSILLPPSSPHSHLLPLPVSSHPSLSSSSPPPDSDLPTPMVHLFHPSWLIKDCRTVCTATYSMGTSFSLSHTFTHSLPLSSSLPFFLYTSPRSLLFCLFLLFQNSYSAPFLFNKFHFTVKILASLQCNHGAYSYKSPLYWAVLQIVYVCCMDRRSFTLSKHCGNKYYVTKKVLF